MNKVYKLYNEARELIGAYMLYSDAYFAMIDHRLVNPCKYTITTHRIKRG